jgi:uncharacterized protein YjbI with pentapeptide repeats
MADPEHVRILAGGVDEWNRWRKANPAIWPDLPKVQLPAENLDGINLENANLRQANLEGASLTGANLRNANLMEANLQRSCLTRANLQEANLYKAELQEAEMGRANLVDANLIKARIKKTQFSFATFGQTSFDHHLILGGIGLDLIYHTETSILDVQVFEEANRAVRGNRDMEQRVRWFFQNAGVTERIVKAALEALALPRTWSSCFVSYSHVDREFVGQLCASLDRLGIPYRWDDQGFDVGSRTIEQIAGEIIRNDRTLLCCSWASLTSHWVELEAEVALEREEKQGRPVLVPLDLDGCLLDNPYRPDGPALAKKIRDRVIGDFRQWRNPDRFDASLARLAESLKAGGSLAG